MLNKLEKHVQARRANTQRFRRFMTRSAVAVMLREVEGEIQVLLIKRADKKSDRWSGHMAFPGGRAEKKDMNSRATAIRETVEEIGFQLKNNQYVGRLSDVMTLAHGSKRPMVVSPYVFKIEGDPIFKLNHEVAKVIWVPLAFLSSKGNRESMSWTAKGINLQLPCYFYLGHRIWGLTLKMLDELVMDVYSKLN